MKYEVERAAIVLSVRELCARAILPHDLDLRAGSMRQGAEAAETGRAAHKLLQKKAAEYGFEAEVPLCNTTQYRGICYEVSGRADGILHGEIPTVEEIKTVGKYAFEQPPSPFHQAQAICYAYFLCRKEEADAVQIRLTLCRAEDGKTRTEQAVHSAAELEKSYLSLLSHISDRAELLQERSTVRLPSVHSGRFPFSGVREGQELLLKECYRDIRAGKRLFVQAPTGIGKTVSTLYPAVRALGEGYCDKIFYLTAKASTRHEAYQTSARIYEAGSHLRTVVLTAREQLCPNAAAKADPLGVTGHCNPEDCPRARGFYQRCGEAMGCLLRRQSGYPRSSIEQVAAEHEICPYEFQLALSELCDIIICDYNYVFDPQVYLRRYFDGDAFEKERYVFLVDEAHNLGDRACDMYSAELCCSTVEQALLQLEVQNHEGQWKPLEDLAAMLRSYRKLCADNLFADEEGVEHGYYLTKNPMLQLSEAVMHCRALTDKWLFLHKSAPAFADVQRLSTALKRFEMIAQVYDSYFLTFVELQGREIAVRQICLDPSRVLDAALNRAHAAVLFSATLTPTDYFADILGGGRGALKLTLPSPFRQEQVCIAAVTGVSTRYEDRDKSVKKIAAMIAATVSARSGNYIVYFPSYAYMGQVHKAFCERYPAVETVVQTQGMNPAEKEGFLSRFSDDRRLRIGFCVLGGSFSEGVDLPGRRLIGVMIVGVGLPGISNSRNLLREHYDTTRERGYDYAYTYPGMNRVLQAAGRVIRTEEDRGVIVLVDDRYASDRYKPLLPEHWSHLQYAGNAKELANITAEFWKRSIDKSEK